MFKLIVILLVLVQCTLCAQQDSMDLIEVQGPEVSIDGLIATNTELTVVSSDNNIADILAKHTGIQIQTQGGSYLRTALYRGQSARHMAILWEGVNIQNSFNGTYDLGLIPGIFFDQSKWYDGGQSAIVGTAAMSGTLVLNENSWKPLLTIGLKYNDQNNCRINLGLNRVSGRLTNSLKVNLVDNENAFRYHIRDEIIKRKNSNHNQFDLSYRAQMQWSNSMQTNISYWYQDVNRKLAPSIIATNLANQEDRNHRFSIGHDWQWSPKLYWSTRFAYMNEYLGYRQPGIESLAKSNIVNLNSKIKFEGRIDHMIGVLIRHENGELIDTINPSFESFFPERMTYALYYNGTFKKNKTTLSFSARQESIDGSFQIPTSQLAIKYNQSDNLNYTFNFGRHYSYPGFNDLYWPLGGNPNLSTEKSWQIECGISYHGLIAKIYQINTIDKILWAPNEQNIWTPENVSSTKSSGFEIKYNRKLNVKGISITLSPIVNYNHTINTAEGSNKGKQLLYNPKLNLRLNTTIKYKRISLLIDESYTGRRFQTLDNVGVLDPYNLLSGEINYKFEGDQKYKSEIYIGVQNSLDQNFELVRFFPQPLRSFYLGINFSIQ